MNLIAGIDLSVLGLGHLLFVPVLIMTTILAMCEGFCAATAIATSLAGLGIMSSWLACTSILNFNR